MQEIIRLKSISYILFIAAKEMMSVYIELLVTEPEFKALIKYSILFYLEVLVAGEYCQLLSC